MAKESKHIPNIRFPQLQGGKKWNVECIGALFCSFPTASYSRMQLKDKGTIGYIHYGDIHTKYNTFLDLTTSQLPHISEEQRKQYVYLKDGDIILADASEDYAGVGKCIEILNTNGHRAISGLHTILLREEKNYFTEKFKAYLFQSPYVKRQLEIKAVGTKIYSISFNSIRDIRIPYPPISEQKKIADCLSSLDDYINATQEKIEILQAHKKGLMQHLFPILGKDMPKLRFPKFNKSKGWKIVKLKTICHITNGKANTQDHHKNGKYPLFDRSAITKASDEYIFDAEAVIIPGEGVRFIPKYYNGKFNLHQRAYALKDFTCNALFVYYIMQQKECLLAQKAVQSTVLSLRLPILQEFPIELPTDIDEQKEIAECLASVDDLIDSTKQKLVMLQNHKRGLMQQLFPTV